MTARAVGLVQHANGTNARSAARRRIGAKQWLMVEKNRRSSKVVRTGGRPMDMRMQCRSSIVRFLLMKAPCHSFPTNDAGLARRARTNQRAVLIPAANAAGCLPPNGYMDSTTTIRYVYFIAQPDVECATPTSHRTRWMILHDSERTTAQPIAANARRCGPRSVAPSPHRNRIGQRDCLGLAMLGRDSDDASTTVWPHAGVHTARHLRLPSCTYEQSTNCLYIPTGT